MSDKYYIREPNGDICAEDGSGIPPCWNYSVSDGGCDRTNAEATLHCPASGEKPCYRMSKEHVAAAKLRGEL
jgi:hypothetical protein